MIVAKRFLVGGFVALVLVLSTATVSHAIWAVQFESKTVMPNQAGVSVAMEVFWDLEMISFSVPVVIRSVSGGAFWAPPLPVDTIKISSATASSTCSGEAIPWKTIAWSAETLTQACSFATKRRRICCSPAIAPSTLWGVSSRAGAAAAVVASGVGGSWCDEEVLSTSCNKIIKKWKKKLKRLRNTKKILMIN